MSSCVSLPAVATHSCFLTYWQLTFLLANILCPFSLVDVYSIYKLGERDSVCKSCFCHTTAQTDVFAFKRYCNANLLHIWLWVFASAYDTVPNMLHFCTRLDVSVSSIIINGCKPGTVTQLFLFFPNNFSFPVVDFHNCSTSVRPLLNHCTAASDISTY